MHFPSVKHVFITLLSAFLAVSVAAWLFHGYASETCGEASGAVSSGPTAIRVLRYAYSCTLESTLGLATESNLFWLRVLLWIRDCASFLWSQATGGVYHVWFSISSFLWGCYGSVGAYFRGFKFVVGEAVYSAEGDTATIAIAAIVVGYLILTYWWVIAIPIATTITLMCSWMIWALIVRCTKVGIRTTSAVVTTPVKCVKSVFSRLMTTHVPEEPQIIENNDPSVSEPIKVLVSELTIKSTGDAILIGKSASGDDIKIEVQRQLLKKFDFNSLDNGNSAAYAAEAMMSGSALSEAIEPSFCCIVLAQVGDSSFVQAGGAFRIDQLLISHGHYDSENLFAFKNGTRVSLPKMDDENRINFIYNDITVWKLTDAAFSKLGMGKATLMYATPGKTVHARLVASLDGKKYHQTTGPAIREGLEVTYQGSTQKGFCGFPLINGTRTVISVHKGSRPGANLGTYLVPFVSLAKKNMCGEQQESIEDYERVDTLEERQRLADEQAARQVDEEDIIEAVYKGSQIMMKKIERRTQGKTSWAPKSGEYWADDEDENTRQFGGQERDTGYSRESSAPVLMKRTDKQRLLALNVFNKIWREKSATRRKSLLATGARMASEACRSAAQEPSTGLSDQPAIQNAEVANKKLKVSFVDSQVRETTTAPPKSEETVEVSGELSSSSQAPAAVYERESLGPKTTDFADTAPEQATQLPQDASNAAPEPAAQQVFPHPMAEAVTVGASAASTQSNTKQGLESVATSSQTMSRSQKSKLKKKQMASDQKAQQPSLSVEAKPTESSPEPQKDGLMTHVGRLHPGWR